MHNKVFQSTPCQHVTLLFSLLHPGPLLIDSKCFDTYFLILDIIWVRFWSIYRHVPRWNSPFHLLSSSWPSELLYLSALHFTITVFAVVIIPVTQRGLLFALASWLGAGSTPCWCLDNRGRTRMKGLFQPQVLMVQVGATQVSSWVVWIATFSTYFAYECRRKFDPNFQ